MASAGDNEFLYQAAIYLGATAVAVPLFKRLKLGTILGFLAAGMILGPYGLGWLTQEEGVFHIAELGVVLFLFVIGLELSVARLWSLRQTIFGLGLLQMLITGMALGFGFDRFVQLPTRPAYIAGFALACSSTAFALSLLQERRELNTAHGVKSFSVLLFQDLAVIPLLAAIPFVATNMHGGEERVGIDPWTVVYAGAAILGIVILGRTLLNRFLKLVAVSGSREAFTAAALFVVAITSITMDLVGLSMALGAFLAGVVLAESAFRHQIEADIEPFRELLLGLFFIGVGMQLSLTVVAANWGVVLLGAVALIAFKMAVLYGLTRLFSSAHSTALRTAAVLCQGGEFGFVVFSLGAGSGIFESDFASLASAVITLTMMATPPIVIAVTRLTEGQGRAMPVEGEEVPNGSVLIVGFGRVGQLVNQVLTSSGVAVTAIDNDPRRIELAAQFGTKVYFGDGTDIRFLTQAGAKDVDAIIFSLSARDRLKTAIAALRERYPNVRILVRVYDRIHELEIMDLKADVVVREMFESSITISQKALGMLGFSDQLIAEIIAEYRERDRDRLLAQKAEGLHAKKDVLSKPFQALDNAE